MMEGGCEKSWMTRQQKHSGVQKLSWQAARTAKVGKDQKDQLGAAPGASLASLGRRTAMPHSQIGESGSRR